MNTSGVVMAFSGGLDSTTMLYDFLSRGYEVYALSVDYGQRHKKELQHAIAICQEVDVPLEFADLRGVNHLMRGSSQTDPAVEVPEGHYADDTMKATVVPNRNMIMLSVASAWAITLGVPYVAYGAHAGDHPIYPDCRPEFITNMHYALDSATEGAISLIAPFSNMGKHEIVQVGHRLKVPFEKTWSCYKGELLHCGKCGTCVERREAFELAGVVDPTRYVV